MEQLDNISTTSETVEIRVPTYKRPKLLQRALKSVLQQTYTDWVVFVFDDSPEQEAKPVIRALDDSRIIYQKNEHNMGGAANIDQSFTSGSLSGSAGYATILEDDNWWHPDFLKENVESLKESEPKILLRNQEVWEHNPDGEPKNTGRTTRGRWMQEGELSVLTLHACLFFFEGVSNGGLFWETGSDLNLQVGADVHDPGLQEYCRTLQIGEPILFKEKPLAVWSRMEDEQVTRYISESRIWGRGRQAILRYLRRCYGKQICYEAEKLAEQNGRYDLLDHAKSDLFRFSWKCRAYGRQHCIKLKAKAVARYVLIPNPVKTYLKKKRPLE